MPVFRCIYSSIFRGALEGAFSLVRLTGGTCEMHFHTSTIRGAVPHHICAYWFFVLISMHLGFHWNMILCVIRKALERSTASKLRTIMLRVLALLIATAGVYAFAKHQIGAYMLNTIEFAFFDYNQHPALFFLEYMAVMGLFGAMSHYLGLLLRKNREGSKHDEA